MKAETSEKYMKSFNKMISGNNNYHSYSFFDEESHLTIGKVTFKSPLLIIVFKNKNYSIFMASVNEHFISAKNNSEGESISVIINNSDIDNNKLLLGINSKDYFMFTSTQEDTSDDLLFIYNENEQYGESIMFNGNNKTGQKISQILFTDDFSKSHLRSLYFSILHLLNSDFYLKIIEQISSK